MLRERGVARVARRRSRSRHGRRCARARTRRARARRAHGALASIGERFDGVHLAFVIETMDGDEGIAALRACAALLEPDGLLVVRTLNPRNAAVRDGALWLEPWTKRPWPLETLHVVLTDLGLRIVGAGNEPEGWQHTYVLGRAPAAAQQRGGARRDGVSRRVLRVQLDGAREPRARARAAVAIPTSRPSSCRTSRRRKPSVVADARFGALRERARRGVPPCDVLIRQSNGAADFRRVDGAGAIVQILPWEYGALPRAWVDGIRAGGADEVWTPTEYCRTMFLEAGIAPERVAVVPNGIDPERFSPERERRAVSRPDAEEVPVPVHRRHAAAQRRRRAARRVSPRVRAQRRRRARAEALRDAHVLPARRRRRVAARVRRRMRRRRSSS